VSSIEFKVRNNILTVIYSTQIGKTVLHSEIIDGHKSFETLIKQALNQINIEHIKN